MRIVIDMQGAQTESRFRGIGRYTMSFAQAVVRNRGQHEIILALSGLFPETIESIRAAFDGLLPQENIRIWHASAPVKEEQTQNENRREMAELLREAFLASLKPDVIHISSLFEGYIDDAVTTIGGFDTDTPVSVILYDLIPLRNPKEYLRPNPNFERYYLRKVNYLRRASLYLAISDFSRKEGVETLDIANDKTISISTAIDGLFQPLTIDGATKNLLTQKFNIRKAFVLYSGGVDKRKNLSRLIEAFAALPKPLRDQYQLVLAGKMPESHIEDFKRIASTFGLQPDELLFAGFVNDEELVQLYNICELFVLPSWHEGFGLPALEAMACGAPVIGANTASLPEVIGLQEAMFDPYDAHAIAVKIAESLQDEVFRKRLRKHGLAQAKRFSWDTTALRAIAAWEAMPVTPKPHYFNLSLAESRLYHSLAKHRPPMADADEILLLSAHLAQNQQSGIERQLFLDVSELCQRDSATGVQRVVRSYLKWLLHSPPAGYRIEPIYATPEAGYFYARGFVKHFQGLHTVQADDEPIRWQRGDIFFGLDMQHHVQIANAGTFSRLRQEGVVVKFLVYDLLPIQLPSFFNHDNAKALHEQWLSMIALQDEAICISKATADAYETWIRTNQITIAPGFGIAWVHIGADLESSQSSRGLPADAQNTLLLLRRRPSFLTVSTLEPRKAQSQILDAVELMWSTGEDVNLVFVGKQGWKVDSLVYRIDKHPEKGKRLFWLEGISDEYLDLIYQASACLVAASINEGFGLPLIEAARHGVAIIARDIPVFREVASEAAFYFSGESGEQLAQAMSKWLNCYRKGSAPASTGVRWSTWEQSAEQLKVALVGRHNPRRQLLVDVSELVQRDAKSGIQRVVRSILKEWLLNPPNGYRVEPVYATLERSYRYARNFTKRFIASNDGVATDEPIVYAPGDIFFALDLQPSVQVAQRSFYQTLRRQGVLVKFLVHDLLCIRMPQYFPPGSANIFSNWLEVVAESDGAVSVSKTTAEDLEKWIASNGARKLHSFENTWIHIGADMGSSNPTKGLPQDGQSILQIIHARPSFLVVGTLEPRKGHEQVLDAFDLLWKGGFDFNLVFAGKEGWMVEHLIKRLCDHTEIDKRLFWLSGLSDDFLAKVYSASTCLIAASYGEGFGLPLIEAARYKLPIFCRDIPAFREVAGSHAFFFTASDPRELASSIEEWLVMHTNGQHPTSDEIPWQTWKQSANKLLEELLNLQPTQK